MDKNERCAMLTCPHKAKYFMTWDKKGVRESGYVCGTHNNYLARQNLKQQGFTKEEIAKIEKSVKEVF